jgi:hypothetical protein
MKSVRRENMQLTGNQSMGHVDLVCWLLRHYVRPTDENSYCKVNKGDKVVIDR